MVKLLGYSHSTTGVPVFFDCMIGEALEIETNEVYALNAGKLAMEGTSTMPLFVACENHGEIEEGEYATVRCYRMLPGMEFEASYSSIDNTPPRIGDTVDVNLGNGAFYISATGRFIISEIITEKSYGLVRIKVI